MLGIPEHFSLSDESVRMSGPELELEVASIARALRAVGVGAGERVLIVGRKSVELPAAILAVMRAGAIAIAPHHGLKAAQVQYIIDDATPSIAIALTSADRRVVDQLVGLQEVVEYRDLRVLDCDESAGPQIHPDDPAMIIYTSGSTGRPKGILLSHENIELGAESTAELCGLGADDRVLCLLPFSFDAGFNQFASALLAGCEVHLRDFTLPHIAAAVCAEHGITTVTGVPPLWRRLVSVDWPDAARASMRRWCSTGGHVPVDLSTRVNELFPSAEPILMYGFSEAFRATYLPPTMYAAKPTSVGIAIPHAAVAVIGEDGNLCAPGEVGELVQFGPLVTLGYWNRRQETERKFAPLGDSARAQLQGSDRAWQSVPPEYMEKVAWSGDDVTVDEDGCIAFRARRTALMKSMGFRVSPTEIEEACAATGLVDEVVAFGLEHRGEEVIAVVARPLSEDTTEAALSSSLRSSLATYQQPRIVHFRESLPIMGGGKYDLIALRREIETVAGIV